ncbi:response regulator [Larsenimonas suaedae]|uniref:Response regulator n=1 Tax=Larsenimonas suaedae TaxID=1851019 RepID=A0ABU1GU87_9GAMM|nr:response regulator [Larsenimonas suaedae]MCM2972009.1 response regulator [Larsenimonas suaedae]MDR5895561.1 response regulator [Larsenimonas suaedae]
MTRRILIVEDEPKIAALLTDYLTANGFEAHHLDHGDRVHPWLADHHVDLILMDVMLPGKDGLTLCRELLRGGQPPPIILLTAKVEEIDRLLGLELGADDYICKPFSPREVVARVRTILRRVAREHETTRVRTQDIELDEHGWRAFARGQDLQLTAVEFQLLRVMMMAPGRIFSRNQLMDHMYQDHRIVSERTVDSHVKKLRHKLSEVWPRRTIVHSVYSVGYKYEPTPLDDDDCL